MKAGTLKRLLLFVLVLALSVGSFSMVVFAEDQDQTDPDVTTQNPPIDPPTEGPGEGDGEGTEETGTPPSDNEKGLDGNQMEGAGHVYGADFLIQALNENAEDLFTPAAAPVDGLWFTASDKDGALRVEDNESNDYGILYAVYPYVDAENIDSFTIYLAEGVTVNESTIDDHGVVEIECDNEAGKVVVTYDKPVSEYVRDEIYFWLTDTNANYPVTIWPTAEIDITVSAGGTGIFGTKTVSDETKSLIGDVQGGNSFEVDAKPGYVVSSVKINGEAATPKTGSTTEYETGFLSIRNNTIDIEFVRFITGAQDKGGDINVEWNDTKEEVAIFFYADDDKTVNVQLADGVTLTASASSNLVTIGTANANNVVPISISDYIPAAQRGTTFFNVEANGVTYEGKIWQSAGVTFTVKGDGVVDFTGTGRFDEDSRLVVPGTRTGNSIFLITDVAKEDPFTIKTADNYTTSIRFHEADWRQDEDNEDKFYASFPASKRSYKVDITFSAPSTGGGGGNRGGGNGGQSGGGGGGGTGFTPSTTTSTTSTSFPAVTATAATSAANTAISAAQSAGETTAVVKFTNQGSIPADALASIASAATEAGVTATIQADSVIGGVVELRMTFNPAGVTTAIDMGGSTTNAEATRIKTFFGGFFANKLAVIDLNHSGAYGAAVRMAAKVDLTGMDVENLCLYTYDAQTNQYNLIANPDCRVDANGYLWFTTTQGGAIIVSEGPLSK